jgi:hypothetical protein
MKSFRKASLIFVFLTALCCEESSVDPAKEEKKTDTTFILRNNTDETYHHNFKLAFPDDRAIVNPAKLFAGGEAEFVFAEEIVSMILMSLYRDGIVVWHIQWIESCPVGATIQIIDHGGFNIEWGDTD